MVKIVYAGKIYRGKEKPEVLLQALRELLDEQKILKDDYQVEIYGDEEGWLNTEIGKWGLAEIVKQCGRVTQERMLEIERGADILWLIKWDGINKGDGWLVRALSWLLMGKRGFEYSREFNKRFAGRSETGVIPLKFYEYIATMR